MLMDEDCKYAKDFVKLSKDDKKAVAEGSKFTIATPADAETGDLVAFNAGWTPAQKQTALQNVDYDYLRCSKKGGSGMSDLLPLMMMGGQGGAMGGMDPMMMMLLLDD